MLKNTFLHLHKIGKATERKLWEKGILTWDDYIVRVRNQLYLTDEFKTISEINLSQKAYDSGNVTYFSEKIPSSEYYRIALSYPNDVLFLDIETTGLSVYYDYITLIGWSIGGEYGCYVNGNDTDELYSIINNAKIIVTFNGTLFDIKFIQKFFPDINIPSVHIDLRYFANRMGFAGGQKKIEKDMGFIRSLDISDVDGEMAPILWHQYRRGDNLALERLIKYNYTDIEGMRFIYNKCIEINIKKKNIPSTIGNKINLEENICKRQIDCMNVNELSNSFCIRASNSMIKPQITYDELTSLVNLDSLCICGIDLVSSETKESGFCILRGNKAETCRLKSDNDIIEAALDANVQLVSVDSPLSIPQGRKSYFDDDITRKQFGIMRECERILWKRGVPCYPCLIKSMQKLTRRGIELAQKFRNCGIPVIESYPGAAQDILNIPRKQAGLRYLSAGLKDFGLSGNFEGGIVSHDELDAVTSALVGLFFWAGKFEALGNPIEKYLIIPEVKNTNKTLIDKPIIGLCGSDFSGKTTIALHLRDKGFKIMNSKKKKTLLENNFNELSDFHKKKEINPSFPQIFNNNYEENLYSYYDDSNIVIDSVNTHEDFASLVEYYGSRFYLIHVFRDNILNNIRHYVNSDEILIDESFKDIEDNNINHKLKGLANININNNGTKVELYQKIDRFLGEIQCR